MTFEGYIPKVLPFTHRRAHCCWVSGSKVSEECRHPSTAELMTTLGNVHSIAYLRVASLNHGAPWSAWMNLQSRYGVKPAKKSAEGNVCLHKPMRNNTSCCLWMNPQVVKIEKHAKEWRIPNSGQWSTLQKKKGWWDQGEVERRFPKASATFSFIKIISK